MDFFSKNNSYMDDKISIWNLDNRYSLYSNNDNMLVDVFPFRTGGISYYHRLRLMMHNMDNAFLGCPNHGLKSSFFVRNKILNILLCLKELELYSHKKRRIEF